MKRVLALLTVLVACDSPTVPPRTVQDVYDFRLPTTPPSVFRWPSGSRIRVFVDAGQQARATQMLEAFELGAARWNAAARYREYELTGVDSITDADVVLRWSDELSTLDFTGCEPQISNGVTTLCLDETDETRLRTFPFLAPRTGSTVKIVVTILASEASRPDRVERLVAHELGHVLGLARHSPDTNDLMFAGNPVRSTLSRRDSATVQVLYHTRATVTPHARLE
jgi:predicted Zn-dependent protease